jgi:hypothetical protein
MDKDERIKTISSTTDNIICLEKVAQNTKIPFN